MNFLLVKSAPRPFPVRPGRPKEGLALATVDGAVNGYVLLFPGTPRPEELAYHLARWEDRLQLRAYGWQGGNAPPAGRPWRQGRLFGLLTALAPFVGQDLPFGPPERLTVLLCGRATPELALAARFLAPRVGGLFLVAPTVHFRRNLAARLLAEYGLAIGDGDRAPARGWEVAVDLRFLPPIFRCGARLFTPRVVFPRPLAPRWPPGELLPGHPVWAECHLACLWPEKEALPFVPSPSSLSYAFSLLEELGVRFVWLDKV